MPSSKFRSLVFSVSTRACSKLTRVFLHACDSSGEFQSFAMTHPEYAKLFTTYLELQRYQAIQEATPGDLELAGQASSGEKQEDSTSDKKDDWGRQQL